VVYEGNKIIHVGKGFGGQVDMHGGRYGRVYR
jgi:hypothetical protein